MNNLGSYAEDILKMRPFGGFVFDCHTHIGPIGTMHVHNEGSAETLIEMMDLVGIDKCATSHMLAISGDAPEGNRLAFEDAKAHFGRIYQYLVYDPNPPSAVMLENIGKYLDEPTTVGIKLHPMWHGTTPADKRYDPVMEIASDRSMPVLIHTWGTGEVLAAENLAKRFPRAMILTGHMGGADFGVINTAIRAAAENANLYLDLTMSIAYDGLIEHMLKFIPAEKILFGSDMAYLDPRSLAGRLAFARIPDDDKHKIFGENFAQLASRVRRGTGNP